MKNFNWKSMVCGKTKNECILDAIYIITVIALGVHLAIISHNFVPCILFSSVFTMLMLVAKFCTNKKGNKYLLGLFAFLIFISIVEYYSLPFTYSIVINKWTFLVLAFILLNEDYFSPIIAGGYVTIRILALIPHADHVNQTMGRIMGNSNGMIMSTLLMTIIYQVLSKLIFERNKFRTLSITDSLTGVSTFAHTIETAKKMAEDGPISILIADMDRFKQVNDTYGHIAGNKVLIEVAKLIKSETEGLERIVGRLGGDEFVIAVKNDGSQRVLEIGENLLNIMQDKLFVVDPEIDPINLSFSIGQANSSSNNINVEKLLHTADVNMYYNKYRNHRLNIFINKEKPIIPDEGYELLNVLAEKDMYTYVHSGYAAQYAAALARELGMPEERVEDLYAAGWLHDMGKILVSSDIVRKNGSLTDEEYLLIKNHVNYGLNVLKNINLSQETINSIQYHHECWDGTGYPNKLEGETIPIEARILQIADSYSAMIIKRVYRKTFSTEEALKEIKKNSGKQFDPRLVEVFGNLMRKRLDVA